ncbi:DUF397 domain-containing protein [Micromonospora auratinigra]|uniref:DUF397 domain-containing protein n=1 Tax=Micromonospora auratinigra TaxID=261654 RepID=A0A1A9AAL9_9ACTN|nr:DUF397 domain-containing protein [Micromonospora auratinigra]SBT53532.1 protein of unknown function (DUF397) [Micromonospora auratinigra]
MDSQWRKSTRSGSNGACVEARYANTTVEVRDSKNPDGAVLSFTPEAWSGFVKGFSDQNRQADNG